MVADLQKTSFLQTRNDVEKMIMEMAGSNPEDYDYVVTHQLNGKFPIRAAKSLGFNEEQYKTGLLTPRIEILFRCSFSWTVCYS